MDSSSRWDKTLQVVSAVTTLNRGGFQKEDPNYKPQTLIPQPSAPPPAHLYPQQHQPSHGLHHGQSASYFMGHPASPFQSSTPYLPPQQQGLPPTQGYSPPLPSNSQSNPHPEPRYLQDVNQIQGSSSPGGYMHQGSAYGRVLPPEPAADYHSTASASSPRYQGSFDSNHQAVEGYSTHSSTHEGHNRFHIQPEYTFQRSATQDPTSYNQQYGRDSGFGYESSPSTSFDMGQRSYTMPVDHDCCQSWDLILDRCTTCKPIISRIPS